MGKTPSRECPFSKCSLHEGLGCNADVVVVAATLGKPAAAKVQKKSNKRPTGLGRRRRRANEGWASEAEDNSCCWRRGLLSSADFVGSAEVEAECEEEDAEEASR
jgi:hypothetical protein